MTPKDFIYWLLSWPFGGFAAWLFDNTTIFPPHILFGIIIGRAPHKVSR